MNHPIRLLPGALLTGLLFAASVQADAPGTLIRAAELKAKPFIDAASVTNLPDNAPLKVIDTQGGWSQVKTNDGKSGWVRLLNIRLLAPEVSKTTGQTLSELGGVIRTGTTKSAATTGAKGLSREDIANARPNPQEVKKLDGYKAKPAEAEKFAATRKLTAQNVPEL